MERDDRAWAAALASAWLLACLALPSSFRNADGVACAMAVEAGGPGSLLHASHLTYAPLAKAAYLAAGALGYRGRALPILVLLNAALGAACVALFFLLLRRLKAERGAALAGAAGLAASYAFWYYSLEPQVYPWGLLLLLAAALAAWKEEPSPVWVGVLHAFALTGHVLHLCAAPAMLLRLWTAAPAGRRLSAVARYAATGFAATLAAYALAAWAAAPPGWEGLERWALGTAAPPPGASFEWKSGPELGCWLLGAARALWAQPGSTGLQVRSGALLPFQAAATWGLAGWAAWRLRDLRAAFLGLWLAGYLAFVMTWECWNMNYHVSDLAPLWALAALNPCLGAARHAALLAAAAGVVGVSNLRTGILPNASPEANSLFAVLPVIERSTPPEAWIATLDSPYMVYVPYFTLRRTWNLARRPQPPPEGEPVFALPEVVEHPRLRRRLAEDWEWREVGEAPRPTRLYRLTRRAGKRAPQAGTARRTPRG